MKNGTFKAYDIYSGFVIKLMIIITTVVVNTTEYIPREVNLIKTYIPATFRSPPTIVTTHENSFFRVRVYI